MKKRVESLWFLSALAAFLSVAISLSAQQTTAPTPPADQQTQQSAAPTQPTDPQAQQPTAEEPAPPPQAEAPKSPDQAATPAPAQSPQTPEQATPPASGAQTQSAGQTFSGKVIKSGDKYMLQDEASGNTYDVDHQEEMQKYEGKRVKVQGTLDASGKMIRLQ